MKRITLLMLMTIFVTGITIAQDTGPEQEVKAVKKTIISAYVQGIHIDRDIPAIENGFHPGFNMLILKDDNINKVPIKTWIGWIEEGKKKNPEPPKEKTTHKFTMVNISGKAAVARIEIYKDEKHKYTDFMSLYKFDDGWKIVNKIFHTHY